MALLPILMNELIEDRRPTIADLYDQNFGLGLLDNDILRPAHQLLAAPLRSGYLRPWRNLLANESGLSHIENTKNEFKVNLDVQQFKPEELKVKVEGDYIVVDAKHEERTDEHGFISRQFTRRYKLPKDVDINALKSNLSSDGVLSLNAPKKVSSNEKSREIPITHTNAPAVKNKKPEKKGDKMEE